MKIDGREIAQNLLNQLHTQGEQLQKKHVVPHLVIILVGNDPASESYVKQKILKSESIGITATLIRCEDTISQQALLHKIDEINSDPTIHAIIVQQPLPKQIDVEKIEQAVAPEKDVDGFHAQTPYPMPLAEAVLEILENVHVLSSRRSEVTERSPGDFSLPMADRNDNFKKWLQSKTIVIIGKGKTGGGVIIEKLKKLQITPLVIDSKTQNPSEITKKADIIITTVGRSHMLTRDMIKKGVILIGIGMHRGEDGKLHGDYEEADIHDIAGYYTPIPGGVGPVNVAMLLANVIQAAKLSP